MASLSNYGDVIETAKKVGVNLTETKEDNGKVVLRGPCEYAFDRDRLWDQIKTHATWQNKDQLSNPDLIKVGQTLKLPPKGADGHVA